MNEALGTKSVSVVIPVYNEEENVKQVYKQTVKILLSLGFIYEIIFVDDGSQDNTEVILKELRVQDQNVKIIKFSKNHGQAQALLAGFQSSVNNVVVTMDGDLQNDPGDIALLLSKISEGFDFVTGWRCNRKDNFFRRAVSRIANFSISLKTGVKLRDYGCALTAAKKEIIDKVLSYGLSSRFIKPLMVISAKSFLEIKVTHRKRASGKSKYSVLKIIKTGLDFLVNFHL